MSEFNFSPSLYHHHVLDNMTQSLAYDGGDVAQWQQRLRSKLRELVGWMPQMKCPLNVRSIWKRDHEYGTIEKIVFTSEEFCDVPAYVCLPKQKVEKYDFFICLQGHSTGMHNSIAVALNDETKVIDVAGDRDFGIGCMKRNLGALCIEQRSFGERREKVQKMVSEHMCHDAVVHSLALGRTLTGERMWDVERGIDYLESRGDINMDRIGLMGNSGGGTLTLYATALSDRIAFAMPSCSFCTFKDSIMSIYHCADNYLPGILQYAEASDIAGLIAPRPLVIVCGLEDDIFPIEAAKRAFEKVKKIYRNCNAEDKCRMVIGNGGHRFYADDAWPVMKELM